jgi:hypothetical protein
MRVPKGFVAAALASITAFALMVPVTLHAQTNSVQVTRKSKNLYKVDGRRAWIQTRYCYHYGYGDEAVITRSKIIFITSEDSCDIKKILADAGVSSRTYRVNVTYEDSDIYSTMQGVTILTSMCLELGLSEEAVLKVGAGGYGSLIFADSGRRCSVEAVLS